MADRDKNCRDNAARQSGEGQPARGTDERDFGAGGQTVVDTIDKGEARNQRAQAALNTDVDSLRGARDRNKAEGHTSGRRK
jgi:hypothetical protein